MFITRLILILLGFWVVRQLLGAWARTRRPRETRNEAQPRAPGEPLPFDGANIRDAEFEDLESSAGEGEQGRGAGQGRP